MVYEMGQKQRYRSNAIFYRSNGKIKRSNGILVARQHLASVESSSFDSS